MSTGSWCAQLSSKPQPVRDEEPPPVPSYWLYHPTPLPKNAGMNRYVWDLRYAAPDAMQHTYPISARSTSAPMPSRKGRSSCPASTKCG